MHQHHTPIHTCMHAYLCIKSCANTTHLQRDHGHARPQHIRPSGVAIVYQSIKAHVSKGHALEMLYFGRARRAEDNSTRIDVGLSQLRLKPEHCRLGVLVQPQDAILDPPQNVDPYTEELLCYAPEAAEVAEDELVLWKLVLLACGQTAWYQHLPVDLAVCECVCMRVCMYVACMWETVWWQHLAANLAVDVCMQVYYVCT
jgi:hypothetical protein